jgi:hypothetical protein
MTAAGPSGVTDAVGLVDEDGREADRLRAAFRQPASDTVADASPGSSSTRQARDGST